jgi:hypothetical protein
VRHSTKHPKAPFAFDLHVLGTPPAFVLSQDQTLKFDSVRRFGLRTASPYVKLYLLLWSICCGLPAIARQTAHSLKGPIPSHLTRTGLFPSLRKIRASNFLPILLSKIQRRILFAPPASVSAFGPSPASRAALR